MVYPFPQYNRPTTTRSEARHYYFWSEVRELQLVELKVCPRNLGAHAGVSFNHSSDLRSSEHARQLTMKEHFCKLSSEQYCTMQSILLRRTMEYHSCGRIQEMGKNICARTDYWTDYPSWKSQENDIALKISQLSQAVARLFTRLYERMHFYMMRFSFHKFFDSDI